MKRPFPIVILAVLAILLSQGLGSDSSLAVGNKEAAFAVRRPKQAVVTPFEDLPSGSNILLRAGYVVRLINNPKDSSLLSTWQIQADRCRLQATCPCADIPASWNCIESYLKIKTGPIKEFQKFCGGNKPGSAIKSDSDELKIQYKDKLQRPKTGFICFVNCIGPGQPPAVLPQVTCPAVAP